MFWVHLGHKFFPLTVDPFSDGRQSCLPESVGIPLKISSFACIYAKKKRHVSGESSGEDL